MVGGYPSLSRTPDVVNIFVLSNEENLTAMSSDVCKLVMRKLAGWREGGEARENVARVARVMARAIM